MVEQAAKGREAAGRRKKKGQVETQTKARPDVIILSDAATEIRAELEVGGYGEEAQKRVQAVLKSMDDLRAWLSAQPI
jgi:hypothetical protein